MVFVYFLKRPEFYGVIWILQTIAYFGILKKMDLKKRNALIPFMAERTIGKTMFETRYAFWHPFILACVFVFFGMYLNPFADRVNRTQQVTANILLLLAFLNYYGYLIRLYIRLCRSFGKKLLFTIGMIFVPTLFLMILGYSPLEHFRHGPVFRLSKFRPKWFRWLKTAGSCLFFAAETLVVILAVGFISIRTQLPWPLVVLSNEDVHESTKNLVSDGSLVSREENMGDQYADFAKITPSRKKYAGNTSDAEKVVVMSYIIGSDLEHRIGAASVNITQMMDATKKGDGVTFVLEAGGSQRWFTPGIDERSVGRYEVSGGNLTKVEELDSYTSMSEPKQLEDFILWAKDRYPADRYFLVLWDHGGGVSSGFGQDSLNVRKDEKSPYGTIQMDEIADAVKNSGIKFDLIGFDACLMQDIEIAYALEPYADYFLASEESEPACGWFYTSAFGKLAENPGLSTEDFGKEIVGVYDAYNKATSESSGDKNTLSLIDLTYVKPAFEKLGKLFQKQKTAIEAEEKNFVNISLAAKNSYTFGNSEQIDLINYLGLLQVMDYDEKIITADELKELISYVKAMIVFRNKNSAEGINGLAVTFPYKMWDSYSDIYKQFKAFRLKDEMDFSNEFFSILACSSSKDLSEFEALLAKDYKAEEWYVKGFEDYVTTVPMIEIPIHETAGGWSLELDDKLWDTIADAKQIYYQKTDKGLKYLGQDYVGAKDEKGHPMVTADGTWAAINGTTIFYQATDSRITENGTVYSGYTKAILNGQKEILLYIEWDPVKEGETPARGHITGYDDADNENAYMEKGQDQLEPGVTLDFLFDYYDEQGQLISTEKDGSLIVVSPDTLTAGDKSLGSCELKHGVILTDVYQRTFESEMVETKVN